MRALPQDAACSRQRGSSAVEFTLVAIPILLVGLGVIEVSRWFFIKQAISLALLEAGRAGITDHARPASIEIAFERGLLPLFPPTAQHTSRQQLQKALAARQAASGAVPWQIQVVGPNPAVFSDFASSDLKLAIAPGRAVINNNYQAEQYQRHVRQGWPNGRGPLSGATIFEANHLVLHLTYMHEPLVPGMRGLLRLISGASTGYRQQALSSGHLPLQQTLRLSMQSHPVDWADTSAKVLFASGSGNSLPPSQPYQGPCRGVWCNTGKVQAGQEAAETSPGSPVPGQLPPGRTTRPGAAPSTPSPGTPHIDPAGSSLPGVGDAACGTLVCCVEGSSGLSRV